MASFVVPVKVSAESLSDFSPFVGFCNLAITHEYGVIVQYINHAGIVSEKKERDVLLKNMHDEIYHARRITEILIKEGAVPTVNVWLPQTGKSFKKT